MTRRFPCTACLSDTHNPKDCNADNLEQLAVKHTLPIMVKDEKAAPKYCQEDSLAALKKNLEEVRIALAPKLHSRLAAERAMIKAQAKVVRTKRRAAVKAAKEAASAGNAKLRAKSVTKDHRTRVTEQLKSLQSAAKSKRDMATAHLRSKDKVSEARGRMNPEPSSPPVIAGVQA